MRATTTTELKLVLVLNLCCVGVAWQLLAGWHGPVTPTVIVTQCIALTFNGGALFLNLHTLHMRRQIQRMKSGGEG